MDVAVDWTKRVDFDLIRSQRLARLQEEMKANELDGVMSFRVVTEDGNELLSANVPYCEKLLGETTSSCSCGCP